MRLLDRHWALALLVIAVAPSAAHAFTPGGSNYLAWQSGDGDPFQPYCTREDLSCTCQEDCVTSGNTYACVPKSHPPGECTAAQPPTRCGTMQVCNQHCRNAGATGQCDPKYRDNGSLRPFLYANMESIDPPRSVAAVESQLASMCAAGQRKIALIMYFDLDKGWMDQPPWNGYYGLIVNSHDGELTSESVRRNISNAIKLIVTTRHNNSPCFDEIQFRFAPWHNASPHNWTEWQDKAFVDIWGVISSTRELVESAVMAYATHTVQVYYDLGAELGGDIANNHATSQVARYRQTLWQMYWSRIGSIADTYGFSDAAGPDRVVKMLASYDAVGLRPAQYAIDVYDLAAFEAELDDLRAFGEGNKPILIQETTANAVCSSQRSSEDVCEFCDYFLNNDWEWDAGPEKAWLRAACEQSVCKNLVCADEIFRAAAERGFSVRTIMQWPLHRGVPTPFFGPTLDYANNTPVPRILQWGRGCSDLTCRWMSGYNFSTSCRVDMYSPSWQYLGNPPNTTCQEAMVTFAIPPGVRNAYPSIQVAVINDSNRWNDPITVSTR